MSESFQAVFIDIDFLGSLEQGHQGEAATEY